MQIIATIVTKFLLWKRQSNYVQSVFEIVQEFKLPISKWRVEHVFTHWNKRKNSTIRKLPPGIVPPPRSCHTCLKRVPEKRSMNDCGLCSSARNLSTASTHTKHKNKHMRAFFPALLLERKYVLFLVVLSTFIRC